MVKVTRGDVWLCKLDPTVGHEIQKTRPCLIISPPELHDALRIVIVLPMTTAGFMTPFRTATTFNGKKCLVLADQLRTLDKQRLVKHLGTIDDTALTSTLHILGDMFEARQ